MMSARPSRAPANEAPVRLATRDIAPFGAPTITLLLASGSSHRLARVPRRNTLKCSPSRMQ